MAERVVNGLGLVALLLAMACSNKTVTEVAPKEKEPKDSARTEVGPVSVKVLSGSGDYRQTNEDRVTLSLKNEGGAGKYYLEFVGLPNVPNGSARAVVSEYVDVLEGYEETLTYTVRNVSDVKAVRVYSRPTNTAVYTRSDCFELRPPTTYCRLE